MEGTTAVYTLEKLMSDSAVVLEQLLTNMTSVFGFFTSNTALLWVFIGGVSMLAIKLIRGLF